MTPSPSHRLALLTLALLAPAARAEGPPAGATVEAASTLPETYPLAAALQLAPESASATYVHDARTGGPLNPGVTVALGEQARYAYAVSAGRLFRSVSSAGAALRLTIGVGPGSIDRASGAWQVSVRHAVLVSDDGGAEVARFDLTGTAEVVGLGQGAVPQAFARAAREAAEAFERAFDASPAVATWLAARGLAHRAPPRVRVALPDLPRAGRLAFLEAGLGTIGVPFFGARAGVSGDLLYGLARVDAWSLRFDADPPGDPEPRPARLSATLLGLEAGLVRRLSASFEGRVGLGVHWLASTTTKQVKGTPPSVDTTLHLPKSAVVASGVASLTYLSRALGSSGLRSRLGLELRYLRGAELTFDALARKVDAGSASALVTVGGELPVGF